MRPEIPLTLEERKERRARNAARAARRARRSPGHVTWLPVLKRLRKRLREIERAE